MMVMKIHLPVMKGMVVLLAKRVKTIELNESSINNAIRYLKSYQVWMEQKTELLVRKLVDAGIAVMNEKNVVIGDSQPGNISAKISSAGTTTRATISYEGRDVLFIEFGAGIHYNEEVGQSPNPKGEERGYVIGSYGKGQGRYDSWMYVDDTGAVQRSHGTKATMPVYNADMEIRQKVASIAKEVFK